jgi:peptide/nickel transport system permease protein
MLKFIGKRLFYGFLVIFGVITIVFLLFNVLPSDPARMMLGQRADAASVEMINKDLGRDKPLYLQYLGYLNDLSPVSVHNNKFPQSCIYLDSSKYEPCKRMFSIGSSKVVVLKYPYLRRSYQSKAKVTSILAEAFPLTALLAVVSMLFASLLGIFVGIISALKKDTWFDRAAMVFSVIGMSAPSFFAAIIIAWLFAFVLGEYTGLNMIGSLYTIDDFGEGVHLSLQNIILPALTLGIRPLAVIVELTRSSMLDVMSQDYIRTARAKGLSSYKVIMRHALKNVLNPVITAISGWFASLLAGAVFVEYVFDWKGMGMVMVDGLSKYDFPVVMGALLLISVSLVLINILTDIVYGWLDPRIRMT